MILHCLYTKSQSYTCALAICCSSGTRRTSTFFMLYLDLDDALLIYIAQQGRWLLWVVHRQVTNGFYAFSLLKDARIFMEWWELNDLRKVVAGPLEYILSQVHPNLLNQKITVNWFSNVYKQGKQKTKSLSKYTQVDLSCRSYFFEIWRVGDQKPFLR